MAEQNVRQAGGGGQAGHGAGTEDRDVRGRGQDPGGGGANHASDIFDLAPAGKALGSKVAGVGDQVLVLEGCHRRPALARAAVLDACRSVCCRSLAVAGANCQGAGETLSTELDAEH